MVTAKLTRKVFRALFQLERQKSLLKLATRRSVTESLSQLNFKFVVVVSFLLLLSWLLLLSLALSASLALTTQRKRAIQRRMAARATVRNNFFELENCHENEERERDTETVHFKGWSSTTAVRRKFMAGTCDGPSPPRAEVDSFRLGLYSPPENFPFAAVREYYDRGVRIECGLAWEELVFIHTYESEQPVAI